MTQMKIIELGFLIQIEEDKWIRKLSKKIVFYEITRFLCIKSKNAHEQKWFKIITSMCLPSLRNIYELDAPGGPNPPWVPHHPRPGRLPFFYFIACRYTSMVTKNKFFAFPARAVTFPARLLPFQPGCYLSSQVDPPPWLPVCIGRLSMPCN